MKIWVDADACPAVIKDILFRAAQRTGLQLTLVANRQLDVPRDANIAMLTVTAGFDVADSEIVRRAQAGDLVITSDLPLAAEVLENGALALSPRGELFTTFSLSVSLCVSITPESRSVCSLKTNSL